MKKNLKKTFAKATALAMAVAMMVSLVPADSVAAKKAKNPKLAKSVKVTVKKTKKVKIKNTKKIKKTKWSIKSKKIATLSKKKKTSVVVKGKKAGTTKLTAKVTLKGKKKAKKLTMKVKVVKAGVTNTPTPKPTTKATTKPTPTPKATAKPNPATPTPAPTPDKFTIKDGDKEIEVEVDKEASKEIPVTELNETSFTCNAKRTAEDQDANYVGGDYTKKGFVFTTKTEYNSGPMYYLDPITSEDDLEDVPEGASNQDGRITVLPKEGKGKKVDIADYDYIRVILFDSPYEASIRLYNDFDQFLVEGKGMVGQQWQFVGYDSTGRGDHVKKEELSPGSSGSANHYFKDAAQTQEAGDGYFLISVSEVIASAKTSEFNGIAVCGQFQDKEYGIGKIELLKAKGSVPADKPVSMTISAPDNATAIEKGDTLQLSAKVLNKNGTELEDTVTWAVTAGDAATIDATTGLLTAGTEKTGEVTVTATSALDNTVKETYTVNVIEADNVESIAFTNQYTTYTIEEIGDGLNIAPKGMNAAGRPVSASKQPEITVTSTDKTGDVDYDTETGMLTATGAGSIKLSATSDEMSDEVTITVVDGMRVTLTEDNTGAVPADVDKDGERTKSVSTVEDGVLKVESKDWNVGGWVKVQIPADKTVANVKGLLWNHKIADAKNCDQKPVVVVRYKDDDAAIKPVSKPSQALSYGFDCTMWEGSEYTADDYATGVNLEASFDWNFCYKDGADVEIDATGNEVCFTLGKNGPGGQVQQISNVIVLWGDAEPMPELTSVTVSEGTNATEVPLNLTLQLAATATYQNDKTKTVTKTAEWTSSDTSIATVSEGKVTPKAEGEVKITAKVGDVTSDEYMITVTEEETVDPVTLSSTEELTDGHGTMNFNSTSFTGYPVAPATFDAKKFTKVTYKVRAWVGTEQVKAKSNDVLGNTKVCVNSTTYGDNYNGGWGDGFKKNMLKNSDVELDTETGVFTLTCDTLVDGTNVADCITWQLDGGTITKLIIDEVKFE